LGQYYEFKVSIDHADEREARFAMGDQDSGVRRRLRLYDAAECKLLILKLGERGVLTCTSRDHESLDSFFVIDSFVENLVDPVAPAMLCLPMQHSPC